MADYINIIALSIGNAGGELLAKGRMEVTPVNDKDQPIPCRVGGSTLTATQSPVMRAISGGAIVGALKLANPASTDPDFVLYRFDIVDLTGTKPVVTRYSPVPITDNGSGNWDFATMDVAGTIVNIPTRPVYGGPKGDPGNAATVAVGSTTTGTPGSSAVVANAGSSSAAVLVFTIPQGAEGLSAYQVAGGDAVWGNQDNWLASFKTDPTFTKALSAPFGASVVHGLTADVLNFGESTSFFTAECTDPIAYAYLYDDCETILYARYQDGTVYDATIPEGIAEALGLPDGLESDEENNSVFPADLSSVGEFTSASLEPLPPNSLGLFVAELATDEHGEQWVMWTPDALPTLPAAEPFYTSSLPLFPPTPAALNGDFNMIFIVGQSVADGADSFPVDAQVLTAVANCLMFSEGTHPGAVSPSDTFVPLVQAQVNTTGSDLSSGLGKRVQAFLGTLGIDGEHDMVFVNNSLDGASYSQICGPTDYVADHVNGSPSFANCMKAVDAGIAIAASLGKRFVARCILWNQGQTEGDIPNYFTHLGTYQSDFQAGVTSRMATAGLTGSARVVPMLMTQCIVPQIGLIQLQRALATPLTHVVTHNEFLNEHLSDAIITSRNTSQYHCTSNGQTMQGERSFAAYMGRVLRGNSWYGLMPSKFTLVGKNVVIDYHVPEGGGECEFDTAYVTDPGFLGFIGTGDLNGTSLVGVTKTGPAQVTLTLSQYPSSPLTVKYACISVPVSPGSQELGPKSGARGCWRDNFGDNFESVYQDSTAAANYPLHNYGLSFSYQLTF